MKTMKNILVLTSAAAFTIGSSASFAGAELFKSLDTNQDSELSLEESKNTPEILESWKLMDTDANGSISADEFSKYMSSLSTQETPQSKKAG